jgi:hypothetical protein
MKKLFIPTPFVMNKWSGSLEFFFFLNIRSLNIRHSTFICWSNNKNSWVGKICYCVSKLFEIGMVDMPLCGVITYSMLMLYDSTPIQLMIYWGGKWTFASGNLSYPYVCIICCCQYSTCDYLFAQFIVCVLSLRQQYTIFLH